LNTGNLKLQFSSAGSFDISVLEYNQLLCASDTLRFHVIVAPAVVADFNSTLANANEVSFSNSSTGGTQYHWDFGDNSNSILQHPEHTYTANGSYEVQMIVTNSLGCSDTIVKTVIINQLSIAEHDFGSEVSVYPNPAEDVLFIRNDKHEKLSVVISDVNGKIVREASVVEAESTVQILTQSWNKGMYFMEITSENGQSAVIKVMR